MLKDHRLHGADSAFAFLIGLASVELDQHSILIESKAMAREGVHTLYTPNGGWHYLPQEFEFADHPVVALSSSCTTRPLSLAVVRQPYLEEQSSGE
jgi:hypothetical protein